MTGQYTLDQTEHAVADRLAGLPVDREAMAAVGNLNDYVKFQMAQGMEKGGAGAGGMDAVSGLYPISGLLNPNQLLLRLGEPDGVAKQVAVGRCGPRLVAEDLGEFAVPA